MPEAFCMPKCFTRSGLPIHFKEFHAGLMSDVHTQNTAAASKPRIKFQEEAFNQSPVNC